MNATATVSESDRQLVIALKGEGILLKFDPNEFRGATKNGGVAVMCSDGDVDIPHHHTLLTPRPHCLRVFGGPLLFAPSFRGFRESFAVGLLENLRQGMTVKETKSLYLYFHAPCGVATMHGYGIREQLALAVEVQRFFFSDNFFDPKRTHLLFHVKKINPAGELEQNTYKIMA